MREAPRELDPFQQQLAALRAKLGVGGGESEPAPTTTDPPAVDDRPTA
jgi:hypothetical protein